MNPDALDSPHTQTDAFIYAYVTIDGPFSNWSAHRIRIWGIIFPTVEHAYQYKKFIDLDPAFAKKIKTAASPWQAKQLALCRSELPADWPTSRRSIMRELLAAKLAQHQDVREALCQTGMRAIVEKGNSANNYWGIGKDRTGQNTLGKIWMELRQELFKIPAAAPPAQGPDA